MLIKVDEISELIRQKIEGFSFDFKKEETGVVVSIGDGIALPHTRDTLGGIVTQPVIILGRHPSGIPYGAVDARPVRLFFLLVTSSVTQHLQILARISRLLRDARLREALLAAPNAEAALTALRQTEAGNG